MTLPSIHDYRRIVVITDPTNPDPSLMEQVNALGHIVFQIACHDGLVMLVKDESNEFESVK